MARQAKPTRTPRTPKPTDIIVDLRERYCGWCGVGSDDTAVRPCPSCGEYTCFECVRLYDDGMYCRHTDPDERAVLRRQDWDDDAD